MPIEDGENCEEHSKKITELDTTIKNGKWAITATASIFGLIMMFIGWVANDNLAGIRGDLKEAKGMLTTIQRDTDRLSLEIGYIKQWKTEVEERLKVHK